MISRKIVDTDEFVDMPVSARLLYYELNWRADDDGFVSSPKKITRMAGCSEDDLKILTAKQFIIPFNSGVVLIRDWRIHNYIRSDRYSETLCKDEKKHVFIDPNNRYLQCNTNGRPNVIPTVNTGKDRLGKDRLEIGKIFEVEMPSDPPHPQKQSKNKSSKPVIEKNTYGSQNNVLLTTDEYQRLASEFSNADEAIEFLSKYIVEKKYKSESHNLSIRRWVFDAVKKKDSKKAIRQQTITERMKSL